MAKPKKSRFVQQPPSAAYYKPRGIPMYCLEQVTVTVDEYEALRLVDMEGMDHGAAAERLGVSRPTVARIVSSAHHKVAEALATGKAICIEGGSYVLGQNRYRCSSCGESWAGELESRVGEHSCPSCSSDQVMDLAFAVRGRKHRGGRST